MKIKYEFTSKSKKLQSVGDPFDPKVRDIMSSEVFTLFTNDTVKTLREVFELKAIRHIPIIDDDRRLVGLVSQRDYLTFAVSKLAHIPKKEIDDLYSNVLISEIMGRKVAVISPDAPLSGAAQIMLEHKYGCLPVVEGEKLVGILTESDFVAAFVRWDLRLLGGAA